MMGVLASPDAGVVCPVVGVLILIVWVLIKMIEAGIQRRRLMREEFSADLK